MTKVNLVLLHACFGSIVLSGCSNSDSNSVVSSVFSSMVSSAYANDEVGVEAPDSAEIAIGERFFLETRFAQFFSANAADANAMAGAGDPTLATTVTVDSSLPGPFVGESMNCAACHLVDQQYEAERGGMRSYADFASRSPIPARTDKGDMQTVAVRNSQALVGITVPSVANQILHFDAEFASMEDLVKATLTGRNYGWLASEGAEAIAHIASIMRNDNGEGTLAEEFGGSYTQILAGTDDAIAADFVLPEAFRVDVNSASDQAIFNAVAKITAAYVNDLAFQKDDNNLNYGSPFDTFIAANALPNSPGPDETAEVFSARLLSAVNQLTEPVFVTQDEASKQFEFHDQLYQFGEQELAGLKVFLTTENQDDIQTSGVGNCAACHSLPEFSDFGLHNTGVTQLEYDELHGDTAFSTLAIPDLATRNAQYDDFLPPTELHPKANSRFKAVPVADNALLTDLGAWNTFGNPDIAAPQSRIRNSLCEISDNSCHALDDNAVLSLSLGAFKTPLLRDLGHSAPYMHNGAFDTLESVVLFYQQVAALAQSDSLRNADPDIAAIQINTDDVEALTRFLDALNEDYN